jgi:hypothetical protein
VIIDNLDVVRITVTPNKADAILIIDANAVLTLATSTESLKAIAGKNAKVVELMRGLQLRQLPLDYPSDLLKPLGALTIKESFGFLAAERTDHMATL